MGFMNDENEPLSYEDEYRGYEIYIEKIPDHYKDTYEWMIADEDGIWDAGNHYGISNCLKSAKEAIDSRITTLTAE